ncbi:hypothetical protein M948_21310 [Virgibacillus sp. CM-4]|nr:hypothetical protein M948_21310 [Virgibacillus sp. CM-4]
MKQIPHFMNLVKLAKQKPIFSDFTIVSEVQ